MDVFEYVKGLMAVIGGVASISQFIKWYRNRGAIKICPKCRQKTWNKSNETNSIIGHKEYKYGDTIEPNRKIVRYGCSNCGHFDESYIFPNHN